MAIAAVEVQVLFSAPNERIDLYGRSFRLMRYTRLVIIGEIKHLMLDAGFTYVKTTKCYPSRRGEEYIFTFKPRYKYTFRVSKIANDMSDFGLYVGVGEQFKQVESVVGHDIDVADEWGSKTPLPMWTGENLKKLLDHF